MGDAPLDRDGKALEDASAQLRRAGGDVGHPGVYRALARAALLHASKNQGYRSAADPFANFKESPPVTKHLLDQVQYAYTLMSKQDDALARLIWDRRSMAPDFRGPGEIEDSYQARGGDAMLRERLLDGIVYRAIILAMMDDAPSR